MGSCKDDDTHPHPPVLDKVLRIEESAHSLVRGTGRAVMSDTTNGVVLFGMSPGNPYFKSPVIEDYVRFLGQEKRRVVVVVPQQPAEHTYRAMGSKDAVKRAKKNASQLRSHCRRAIEKVSNSHENLVGSYHMVDWVLEVDVHPAYVTALERVVNVYHENQQFRSDASSLTARVIGKKTISGKTGNLTESSSVSELEDDENIKEGVYYLLKELAFILASKEIYSTEKVSVIYHRSWSVYEKYVNGEYDGEPKEGYGLTVIAYHDAYAQVARRTSFSG